MAFGEGLLNSGCACMSQSVCFHVSVIHTEEAMKISERGQITIPKHLRERFGMNHNVEVEID